MSKLTPHRDVGPRFFETLGLGIAEANNHRPVNDTGTGNCPRSIDQLLQRRSFYKLSEGQPAQRWRKHSHPLALRWRQIQRGMLMDNTLGSAAEAGRITEESIVADQSRTNDQRWMVDHPSADPLAEHVHPAENAGSRRNSRLGSSPNQKHCSRDDLR